MPTRRLATASSLVVGLLAAVALSGCGADPAPTGKTPSGSGRLASYVALGDSYTAAPLVAITNADSRCLRSDHDYPHLVAARLKPRTFTDASCSGATTRHVFAAQYPDAPAQLDAIKADTALVTIGLGGNDDDVFTVLVDRCPALATTAPKGAPCRAVYGTSPTSWLGRALAAVESGVAQTVRAVRQRAPRARIVVVDYPQLVPAHGRCSALPLAVGDYAYARLINQRLDQAVLAGARQAGAETVDLWAASAGHDVCAKVPWINGPYDIPGKAAAYHPLEAEQAMVARLIEQHLAQVP